MTSRWITRGIEVLVLAAVLIAAGLISTASAEDGSAQLSVKAPTDAEIKEGGDEFQVEVLASNVSNLAAFQFGLQYNASVLEYSGMKETPFLGSTGREVMCGEPRIDSDGKSGLVRLNCATLNPPVSLGGKPGPDGSGALAAITFRPINGGETPLELTDGILVAAEIDGQGNPQQISSSMQGASLSIIGTSGGIPWMIVGPLAAIIAVALIAGGGGFLVWKRSRAVPVEVQ